MCGISFPKQGVDSRGVQISIMLAGVGCSCPFSPWNGKVQGASSLATMSGKQWFSSAVFGSIPSQLMSSLGHLILLQHKRSMGKPTRSSVVLPAFFRLVVQTHSFTALPPEVTKTPSEVVCLPFLREATHQDGELVPSAVLTVLAPGPSPLALEPLEEKSRGDKHI